MKLKPLDKHFEALHRNVPEAFNPEYIPEMRGMFNQAVQSMEAEGYYDQHTRQECADEFKRRLDYLKKKAGL